jgi:formate dehydrogenase subunit gamma
MAATTRPLPESADSGRLLRFDGVERALHWTNAALFLTLMTTAAILYVGPLSAAVGRRELIRQIHVWSGLVLPVPLLLAVAGRWGAQLRVDIGRINRWSADDRKWMRSFGRDPFVKLDKFNPGQKLNAAFTAAAIVVMLMTGSIMKWFEPFPVDWRTGATFVHDWMAIAIFVIVVGHIGTALSDPDALSGMVRGSVRSRWARRHRPRWYEEMRGQQ